MLFRLGGVEFGSNSGPLIVTKFGPGAAEVRSSDSPRTFRNGSRTGRDRRGSRTWAFDISTNCDDVASALDAEARLSGVWENPAYQLPGATVPLSYYIEGSNRWRRVYGRPDSYAGFDGGIAAMQGAASITCNFRVTEPGHYDELEQSVPLSIVPASTGGFMAPIVAPISTLTSGTPRSGLLRNAGNAEAPVTIRFVGPIGWPLIKSSTGWEIGLSTVLAYDDVVVVDPITQTVTKNGVPAPGLLSQRSRITQAFLQPGTTEVTFTGTDPTGTAVAVISWRNAYTSI